MSDTFEELKTSLSTAGPDAAIDRLIAKLRSEHKYNDLFDALLLKTRYRLGLADRQAPIDELPEPLRTEVEDAYLAACREVGGLLLADGRLRDAWMFLRPVGDKTAMAEKLRGIEPGDDNLDDIIEIALHEGVAPELGYRLVLENYGTCNAISTFEGALMGRPKADQQAGAALLTRHLHRELLANLQSDIAKQEGAQPPEKTIKDLVADRDWLFTENNYHIDTTHLAAVIRFARLADDLEVLRLADDLTEYGRRLSGQFQFAGEEPFIDFYPSHGLFFRAQFGQQVDEALRHFRSRAEEADPQEHGTAPAEIYIGLLARLKRYAEAIEASAKYLPPGTRQSGFAPSLLDLSREAGDYKLLLQTCRDREDLVGYATGLLEASRAGGGR